MVIEIKDNAIEQFLKKFSYSDLEKFVYEAVAEKIEDLKEYQLLKQSRNDDYEDFEEFLKNENSYRKEHN